MSQGRQLALDFLKELLTPVNHGLLFDEGIAERWRPSAGILIDPEVQFGSPCIEGTRIETESVWSFRQSGSSPDELARLYRVGEEMIGQALAWEETLSSAA